MGCCDEEKLEGGFYRIPFTKIQKAIKSCETEHKEKQINAECKKAFKDLGIEIIEG